MVDFKNEGLLPSPTGLRNQKVSTTSSKTYAHAAVTDNTRRAYQSDIRHFEHWGGRLPAQSTMVIQYLSHFAEELNPRTLGRRLTALRLWHKAQGFADPTDHPVVRKTLVGIKKIHGRPKNKAIALRMDALKVIVQTLDNDENLRHLRDKALLLVGYFGAFRRSELVNIQLEHLNWVPEGVEIMIPRSKTDQTGEGMICALPKSEKTLCAVTALKNWLEYSQIEQGPVFRRINRWHQLMDVPLAPASVNYILKKIAQASGIEHGLLISGHSLRRGFATEAARAGVQAKPIMQQGRWKNFNTVLEYMDEADRFSINAVNVMLNQNDD